jgi:hypothetical protein
VMQVLAPTWDSGDDLPCCCVEFRLIREISGKYFRLGAKVPSRRK